MREDVLQEPIAGREAFQNARLVLVVVTRGVVLCMQCWVEEWRRGSNGTTAAVGEVSSVPGSIDLLL